MLNRSKLWKGAPGSSVVPPSAVPQNEKRDHPEVWLNGVHIKWEPGEEADVPEEALAIWRGYLEANP